MPVTGQLDLKALAAAVGGKRAAMADPAAAERATGYVVGGISPLGQKRGCPPWWTRPRLDPPTVYVAAAAAASTSASAPADLVRRPRRHVALVGRI